jgi:hypothetical protein
VKKLIFSKIIILIEFVFKKKLFQFVNENNKSAVHGIALWYSSFDPKLQSARGAQADFDSSSDQKY